VNSPHGHNFLPWLRANIASQLHLSRGEVTLAQLLETVPTATGIYNYHLQHHMVALEKQPELATALNTVMSATEPVELDTFSLTS
jgi:hypothetical protein